MTMMVSGPDGQQVARKTITLPNVEVGSILEYSFQIMLDDTPSMVAHQGLGSGGPDLQASCVSRQSSTQTHLQRLPGIFKGFI